MTSHIWCAEVGAPLRLLVGAESRIGGVFCDRLSWRVVVLPESRVAAR